MIHRDHRKRYEASSALNQIFSREGPVELTVGDIDTYVAKWFDDLCLLRIIEHKLPNQPIKPMQAKVLLLLSELIHHAVAHDLFGLAPGSGVFIMRGNVAAETEGRRKVDFEGRQTVMDISGHPVLEADRHDSIWNWCCAQTPYTKRSDR